METPVHQLLQICHDLLTLTKVHSSTFYLFVFHWKKVIQHDFCMNSPLHNNILWFRSYFTRTVTTTSTASAVSAVTVRWQTSPSPARTMLFCAMIATATSSPPNVWPAIKPSCLVWMTSAHIISHNSCSFLTNLVQTGLRSSPIALWHSSFSLFSILLCKTARLHTIETDSMSRPQVCR